MTDLVETVARIDKDAAGSFKWALAGNDLIDELEELLASHRRAAIAAVLDDMAEPSNPSEGMMDAVRRLGSASVPKVWQAMLAQYREEMLG